MKNQEPNWRDETSLLPAIIQDAETKQVLMLGYMNEVAFRQTLETKKLTFFSRSRQMLWTKGETSGNYLDFFDYQVDCDQDAILIQAKNSGPTCHKGSYSCFGDEEFSLQSLENALQQRIDNPSNNSYTSALVTKGNKEIAKKIAEEANEVAISAVSNDGRITEEAADLMYHLLVLLKFNKLSFGDVEKVLRERNKKS
jgi:phosphoribosyl-ATP pyrophosphohydrolase/phosphoribosyl-AMP cyclohydrolase